MFAQLGGIWYGELQNDSTHKKQSFEIGLSEYRGKITGFSYTTFIENDTFYYSIKRIKAEKKDGFLIITDDEMVGNNFPERRARGVRQTTVFPLINDSTIDISKGSWSTNQTKKYYSLKGSAQVKPQEDRDQSDLIAHLEEMKVKNDISVRKPKKKIEEPVLATTLPANKTAEKKMETVKQNSLPINKPEESIQKEELKQIQVAHKKPEIASVSAIQNKIEPTKAGIDINKPVANPTTARTQPPPPRVQNAVAATNPISNSPAPVKQTSITEYPNPRKSEQALVHNNQMQVQKVNNAPSPKKDSIVAKPLPAIVATRKNETIKNLYFHSDSLVLSLYDNGMVDGDTVSVFLNGNPLISKQQLKVSAFKKTIYITPDMDSVELVLFADNLGSIPPNTGLLTVLDGDQTFHVRFSADLQKNAAIRLHRKKE
jgi:hypothetical protein